MTQMESYIVCADSSSCLDQLVQRGDVAVAMSRQNALATASDRDIFCFNRANNIRNYSMTLLMRRERVHTPKWNRKIQQTFEGGLIGKWLEDLQNKKEKNSDGYIRPLTIEDMSGVFLLCGAVLSAAFIAFVLELIIHHKLKDRNSHRFWRTADWMIDGRRHFLKLRSN